MDSKKTDTELLSEEKLNDLTAQNILNRAQGDIDAIWNEINQERRLYDAQWQEIFLILLAMLPTTESTILLQKILEDTEIDIFEEVLHQHLFFCARAIVNIDVPKDIKNQVIQDLLIISRDKMPWESIQALILLSRLKGEKEAAVGLLQLASDPSVEDEGLRSYAIDALAVLGYGDAEIAKGLLELTQIPKIYFSVRRSAAEALRNLKYFDGAVVRILLELARNPVEDAFVRCSAAAAMGQGKYSDDVIQILIKLIQDENAYELARCCAAKAVVELGHGENAVGALIQMARNPQTGEKARSKVIKILVNLGHDKDAAQSLIELADNSQIKDEARFSVAKTLGELGDVVNVNRILLALARDSKVDIFLRCNAAETIKDFANNEEVSVVPELLELARDKNEPDGVRGAAARTLRTLGFSEDALQILLNLIHDPQVNYWAARDAIWELGNFQDSKEIVQTLSELINDPQVVDEIRGYAALSLAEFGRVDGETIEALMEIVRDSQLNDFTRRRCAYALRQVDRTDSLVIGKIKELVYDVELDDWVRAAVAESLGALGYKDDATKIIDDMAQILLNIVKDEQVFTLARKDAFDSLMKILNIPVVD